MEWASAWHALGSIDDRSAYRDALERITRSFSDRGAAGGRSALSQIRASMQGEDGHVALYELALDGGGDIARRGLRNTPRANVAGDQAFQRWARAHEVEIRDGRHVLPESLRADVVHTGLPPVVIDGVAGDIQEAFDAATCNGCHRESHGGIDGGFHVSPLRHGRERLSSFLRDDLKRREGQMRDILMSP